MIEVRLSERFADWLRNLRDDRARARIAERLRRLALGNPGDVKALGAGLNELRLDHGPGYRIYFVWRGAQVVVVLAGGEKSTQDRDIRLARSLAKEPEP